MGGERVFFLLKNLLNYIQKGISKKLYTEMILDRAFQVSKQHHWRTGIWLQLFGMTYFLVVGDHVVEGVVQLVGTLLDLQLLPVDLVLDVVDPLVELGDVHLAVLEPGLSGLVLALQVVDLLNQLLLPLQGLLGGLLQLLHVVADSLELLLDALELGLGHLGPLHGPLELSLLHAQLPAQLVQLLLVVGSHLDGGPAVLDQLLDGDLVVETGVLNRS